MTPQPRYRLGVVNYVNTYPLIDGLERVVDLTLRPDVPSRLITLLESGAVDAALCSSIDYQRSDLDLQVLPCGMLGCRGSTMTVRLFSQRPIARLDEVFCDTHSHTSVALLRILLAECHGVRPAFSDFDADARRAQGGRELLWPEAMLLIGDKVVTDATPAIRYPYQLDLGSEWFELTGLPFVFALWMARADFDAFELAALLDHRRRLNRTRLEEILAARVGESSGWPLDLAREYLGRLIAYEWTDEARAGLERFYELAHRHGLIDRRRPLRIAGQPATV